MQPVMHGARPVLLIRDVEATLNYYRDKLGFEVAAFGDPPDFGSASRGEATILFAMHEGGDELVPNQRLKERTWNVYVEVANVEGLFAEVNERGATIDYGVHDAPHGFREFGVQDPDGYGIAFGEPLD
ncbi:MAG: VOC family protein [Actinomycetota bacterium]|nr:VOC family protein [Actinomycetota bacterium]